MPDESWPVLHRILHLMMTHPPGRSRPYVWSVREGDVLPVAETALGQVPRVEPDQGDLGEFGLEALELPREFVSLILKRVSQPGQELTPARAKQSCGPPDLGPALYNLAQSEGD